MGFQVATAVTSYDGKPDIIEDPTIATIELYRKVWDAFDPESNGSVSWKKVTTKMCEESDFNNIAGNVEGSRFLPL